MSALKSTESGMDTRRTGVGPHSFVQEEQASPRMMAGMGPRGPMAGGAPARTGMMGMLPGGGTSNRRSPEDPPDLPTETLAAGDARGLLGLASGFRSRRASSRLLGGG